MLASQEFQLILDGLTLGDRKRCDAEGPVRCFARVPHDGLSHDPRFLRIPVLEQEVDVVDGRLIVELAVHAEERRRRPIEQSWATLRRSPQLLDEPWMQRR